MYNIKKKLLSSENIINNYGVYDIHESSGFKEKVVENFTTSYAANLIVFQGYIKPTTTANWNFIVDASEDADFNLQLIRNDDKSWVKVAETKNSKFISQNGVQLDSEKFYKFVIRNLRRNINTKGTRLKFFWSSAPISICVQNKSTFIDSSGNIIADRCGYEEIPTSAFYIDQNPDREKHIAALKLDKDNYKTQQIDIITNQLTIDNNTSQFYLYFNSLIRNNTMVNKYFDRTSHDANYDTAEKRLGDISNNNTFYLGFPVTANP